MINYLIALAVIVFLGSFTIKKVRMARLRALHKEEFSCSGSCSGCSGPCQ
ncbi:MAG TPA: hypothetical protein VJ863_00365 [Sphaerochaeta sp.]|nr:hypothetical protein [Spirochaetales bacterium]HKL58323.1 hypothetical protein [Sphaerochaeta sp.]